MSALLHAQNTVSLSPSTIFLNAIFNGGPQSATVTVSSTPGAVGISVAPPAVPWLTVTQAAANTPVSLRITGNPAGLGPAVYSTLVTVNTPSGSVPLEVVMTVNPASSLTPTPSGVILNFIQGSGTPLAAQTVTLTSTSPSLFTVTATSRWLLFSTSGQTAPGAPGTVTINADPSQLSGPGVYVAGVTITPASGLPPITIPVVFYYETGATLAAAPSSLTFNFQPFAPNNTLQKTVTLTSAGVPVTFGASTAVTTQGPSWLTVAPTQGTTPGAVTVALFQPGALAVGQYQGTVTITAPGATNPSVAIPVTLNINTQPLLDLNLTNLTYTYQVGGALPPDQFVTPTSTTPNLSYTLATSTNNTGNWLTATSLGATPGPVDVAVNPVGLPVGTYMGTITFNAAAAGNSPQVVNVTLNVVNNPTLAISPASAPGLVFNYETGGALPASQTVQVTSGGAPLSFGLGIAQNSTSNNVNWLQVGTPGATTTPATFTVAVNTTGMTPGQYTGSVTLTTPDGAMQVTLPVTLNITPAGTPLLFTKPQTLSFNILAGGTAADQLVSVNTTGESIIYTATPGPTTPAGGAWLTVGPPSGAASATNISNFSVGLNAALLTPGIYKGSVILQTNNGTPNVVIPVALTVSTGNLVPSAASLTFTQASSGAAPVPQSLTITSTGPAPLAINATAAGGNWLSVTPPVANTPATLAVAVNAGSLKPGNYNGQINIVSAGAANSPLTVPVSVTVTSGQSLSLSVPGGASSLSFTAPAGGAAPPAQTVALAASGGSLPFVANINIASPTGGNWLSVTPIGGTATTTPTNLSIAVNPQGLNPGTYNGSVSISAPIANNGPLSIPVTFVVTQAQPAPAPAAVLNIGSLQAGAVAPGEIVTIRGTNLGPTPGVNVTAGADNHQPTLASDTQVTFDNVSAPLLFVSATRIDAVVPYEVDGLAQTKMVVTYKGVAAAALVLNVAATAPGLYLSTAANVPPTQVAAMNADGTDNSPDNPAAKDTVVVLRATGEGQTVPPGETGLIIPADDDTALKQPLLPVLVTIGGQPADVQSAGSVPGSVSGSLQIKVVVPDTAPSGAAVPITITIGDNSSPEGTTLAIQ